MLAQLFLQGASYTAIADQTALKRGAVEQRLRRHFGGSPQRAREQFLANA
jgi:DNA-directed RNA polymerase specialized sigma24 family protein